MLKTSSKNVLSDHMNVTVLTKTILTTISVVIVFGLGSAPQPLSAQSPARPEVEFNVGNSAIRRTNGLVLGAAQLANIGADVALDKLFGNTTGPSPGKVAGRLARLWLVNLPIAALANGIAHDYGHVGRLDELGARTHTRHVEIWPWPIPITISREPAPQDRLFTSNELLSVFGAGIQASTSMRNNITDKILLGDSADYFDYAMLGYAIFDYTGYAWWDLRNRAGRPDVPRATTGDFSAYTQTLGLFETPAARADAGEREVSGFKIASWLNLLDYSLYAAIRGTWDYVHDGHRSSDIRTLRFGGLKLVPGLRASLTPLGPERTLDVRVVLERYLSTFEVRRIATPTRGTAWGVGAGLKSRDVTRFTPEARIDLAEQGDHSRMFRFEIGLRGPVPGTGGHLLAAPSVGFKTTGYLADMPERSGGIVNLAVTLR